MKNGLKIWFGKFKKKIVQIFGRERYKPVDEKKIEEYMEGYDKIFKTLITPTSFVITLTWTFYFFLGTVNKASEIVAAQILDFYIPYIAVNLVIFISSVFVWSLSVLARISKKEIRLWRWKTGYQKVARVLKRFSLGLLFVALLIAPAQLIVSALTRVMEPNLAVNIYFSIILIVAIIILVFMPEEEVFVRE